MYGLWSLLFNFPYHHSTFCIGSWTGFFQSQWMENSTNHIKKKNIAIFSPSQWIKNSTNNWVSHVFDHFEFFKVSEWKTPQIPMKNIQKYFYFRTKNRSNPAIFAMNISIFGSIFKKYQILISCFFDPILFRIIFRYSYTPIRCTFWEAIWWYLYGFSIFVSIRKNLIISSQSVIFF